jgi:hypothetical protein
MVFVIRSVVKFAAASASGALVLVVKAVVLMELYGKALIMFVGFEREGRA